MVEKNLFAIIDLLPGAKSILLKFIWRVGGGDFCFKNYEFFLHLIFNVITAS